MQTPDPAPAAIGQEATRSKRASVDGFVRVVSDIIRDDELARDVVESIREGLAASAALPAERSDAPPQPESEDRAAARFFDALHEVTLDVDSHPTGTLLKTLLTDDNDLTDSQATTCVEFISSHMVNKFQGSLAEFLAMGLCAEFLRARCDDRQLPPNARLLWGNELREQHLDAPSSAAPAWHQGADGLVVVTRPTSLVILGIVEVKSYPQAWSVMARQVDKHLARLDHGLKVGEQNWPVERLSFGAWDARTQSLLETPLGAASHPAIQRLLIAPRRARNPAIRTWHEAGRDTVHGRLAYSRATLAKAAYQMTVWFVELLGSRVFSEKPSPWPGMDPQEAGVNAVKQALYFLLMRPLPAHAFRVAARLYNVYGFGYEASADHKEMIWIEHGQLISGEKAEDATYDGPGGSGPDELLDRAWSFYRRGLLRDALACSADVLEMRPDDGILRRLRWLRGMLYYFLAEFEAAERELPFPDVPPAHASWANDRLTKARILARLGRIEDAARLIAEVRDARVSSPLLAVSVPLAEALVFALRGDPAAARTVLAGVLDQLQRARAEIIARRHEGRGINGPGTLDPTTIGNLLMESVPIHVVVGDHDRALEVLGIEADFFAPYLTLLSRDALLDPLRAHPELGPRMAARLDELRRNAR